MDIVISNTINELVAAKSKTEKGGEYWMARNIQSILGYLTWENFLKVIDKARIACEGVGIDPNDHFLDTTKKVRIGSGAMVDRKDFFLTRYACYLIAMNGKSSIPEIGEAQTYFAVQARKQEIYKTLTENERREQLRDRVLNANISLAETAKNSGVQNFGLFQNAGYKGLYEMGMSDIKIKKGLSKKDALLDCIGRKELAANELRITQTEEKLMLDKVDNEKQAINIHYNVGSAVRKTILEVGGIAPEDLPTETKLLKRKEQKKELVS